MADEAAGTAAGAEAPTPAPTPTERLAWLVNFFDLTQWPEVFVRGLLCTAVVMASIGAFWLNGKEWALPETLGTMLAATWGFLMALDPSSTLKGWLVIVMVLNYLVMVLRLGWTSPVLGALAV